MCQEFRISLKRLRYRSASADNETKTT